MHTRQMHILRGARPELSIIAVNLQVGRSCWADVQKVTGRFEHAKPQESAVLSHRRPSVEKCGTDDRDVVHLWDADSHITMAVLDYIPHQNPGVKFMTSMLPQWRQGASTEWQA